MIQKIREQSMLIGLLVAVAGMLGSLYFSEVLKQVPCLLCWYQRIAMYPLVVIFAIGILDRTKLAWRYAITFITVGWLIAFYHILLVYGVISEGAATCALGVPCAVVTWSWGFINIPLLSFLAFSLLGGLYFLNRK